VYVVITNFLEYYWTEISTRAMHVFTDNELHLSILIGFFIGAWYFVVEYMSSELESVEYHVHLQKVFYFTAIIRTNSVQVRVNVAHITLYVYKKISFYFSLFCFGSIGFSLFIIGKKSGYKNLDL